MPRWKYYDEMNKDNMPEGSGVYSIELVDAEGTCHEVLYIGVSRTTVYGTRWRFSQREVQDYATQRQTSSAMSVSTASSIREHGGAPFASRYS